MRHYYFCIIFFSFLTMGNGCRKSNAASDLDQMNAIFSKDIEKMGQCLINRDYECYIAYNHPAVLKAYGDKSKMKEQLNLAMRQYKDDVGEYKKMTFAGIDQVFYDNGNIQAIIDQDITVQKSGSEEVERQKILAISEDNGTSWHYIVLAGMNREKVEQLYPNLNSKIIY